MEKKETNLIPEGFERGESTRLKSGAAASFDSNHESPSFSAFNVSFFSSPLSLPRYLSRHFLAGFNARTDAGDFLPTIRSSPQVPYPQSLYTTGWLAAQCGVSHNSEVRGSFFAMGPVANVNSGSSSSSK